MKNTLNEAKDLMLRMEKYGSTGYLSEGTINEVTCKWRDVVGVEAFPDVVSSIKPGSMFTFGYVSKAKIVVPKGKRLNPNTKRMNQYDDYETLGNSLGETGVINVIKVSMYNMPWQRQNADIDAYPEGSQKFYDVNLPSWKDQKSVAEKYAHWKDIRNNLAQKYNVEVGKARYNVSAPKFGDQGGITAYAGDNAEKAAHSYTNLNMHGIRPINTAYYLVKNDGTIKPVDINQLTKLPYKESLGIIEKLRAAGATEEEVAILDGMQYQRFEHSQILFVSALLDSGIPTLLINTKLTDKIGGVEGLNPEEVIKIAQDRYSQFLDKDAHFVKE